MKIALKHLEIFADLLARCLGSGLSMTRSLQLSGLKSQSGALVDCTRSALAAIDRGQTLDEAFEPHQSIFPRFFLPVIRCGQISGRLIESLEYLRDYCRKLIPTTMVIRKTWLYPLIVWVLGWFARLVMILYFGKFGWAGAMIRSALIESLIIVFCIYALAKTAILKTIYDWITLQIPLLRETQVDSAMAVFLRSLSLMYKTGGLHVAAICRLACQTVSNGQIRKDLMRAHQALLDGNSFAQALGKVVLLKDEYKAQIATGELAGKLDSALDKIAQIADQDLAFRLDVFNNFFQRLVALAVACSIAGTAMALIMTIR